jgi:hypothetical protein
MLRTDVETRLDSLTVNVVNERLALVGKGRTTRDFAPWTEPFGKPQIGWDIWTLNEYAFVNQFTPSGMFEMHADALTAERYKPEYREWLMQPHPFPIWMHTRDERIPASVALPWHEISDCYVGGVWHWHKEIADYYTSSTPYALGLALLMGYKSVWLFGIDLTAQQYVEERDCIFFWLGILSTLGVEIHTHKASQLFRDATYGL